jgi:hypothetical protein
MSGDWRLFFYNLIIMKHIARGKKIKAATRVTRR